MGIRGAPVVLVTALALVAAGCSGDDEPEQGATSTAPATTIQATTGASEEPSPTTGGGRTAEQALIADAAEATAAARSAGVAANITVESELREQTRLSGAGAFDFVENAGEMTIRLLEGEQSAFGRRSRAIFVDSSAYYRLPPGVLPDGKRWIQVDLESLAEATGLDFGPLVQSDPSRYLLWLGAVGPGVTRIGEEEIRGVPTTRYRAVIDLNLLESRAPAGKEAEWSAYVQTLRDRVGLDFIPVEVWVDGDGLIRRVSHEHGLAAEDTFTRVTMELFDFGVDVDVQAPPPGQVAAVSDLISR